MSPSVPPSQNTPPRFGFSRGLRLLDGKSFQSVFDQPDWRLGQQCFLLLARETEQPFPRLGLVIAKRRIRHAVDRGAVKRRIREQFRLRQHELAGLDIVVLMRGPLPAEKENWTPLLARLFDKLLAKRRQD
ncbi:ribonuclease P protein component [Alcanivorax sp. 24]|uniref:ribonuclease P protein component n=1 Tax=Alcanivorax sp. 24 TaxID=2545266 RepID=UPI00105D43D5|nr:ribonuclease P protein component [Alcanivorax sp. 24]